MPQVMSPAVIPALIWKVDGIDVSVAVARSVLAELNAGLDRAPADAEFGGILLGSVSSDGDGFRTQVYAFEPLPIEHRYGANYALSPRDQRVLDRRLRVLRRKGRVPVGICRSHQRRGLYLDQRDFDLFRTDFRHPSSIFLLVRRQETAGATGAVFVWEEDDIRRHTSYLEFPLIEPSGDQVLTQVRETPTRPVMAAERPATGKGVSLPEDRAVVLPARPQDPQGLRVGPSPLALLARVPALSFPPAASAKVLLTIALPLFSFYAAREIALHRVDRSDVDQVRPAAEPVRLPSPAIDRDAALASGGKPDPFPATQSVAPDQATVSPPPLTPKPTLASNALDRSEIDVERRLPARRPIETPEGPPARVVPVLPEPPPVRPLSPAASLPRIVASPPTIASRAPGKVIAYFKPAPPSSVRQAFQKVFIGHSAGDGFVPANPVESPLPSPPANGVAPEEGSNIEMLAKVDRFGNVVNVKVVDGNRQLADLSADALLRWRFDPARRNGAAVESAMRVRFEFRNPSQ